ncbi:hypothetical protein GCM10009780_47070 [Actinomadura alba]
MNQRRAERRRYLRSPPQFGQWNVPSPTVRKNTDNPKISNTGLSSHDGPHAQRTDTEAPSGRPAHNPGSRAVGTNPHDLLRLHP